MIDGFSWLEPGKIAGMANPMRGSMAHARGRLKELKQEGVGALVSLTEAGLPRELVAQEGLEYLHLPVRDMTAPSAKQIEGFLEFVARCHSEGLGVGVHCGAGLGRTGTMLAIYLVSKRHCADDALMMVRQLRPGSIETREQEQAVEKYAREMRRRHC